MTWSRVTPFLFIAGGLSILLSPVLGCSEKAAPVATEFHAPESFTDAVGDWSLAEESLSQTDSSRIEGFFQKNSDLLGSPDWTGRPSKYLLGSSKSKVRYYWFAGGVEQLTWNALEFQGNSMKQFSGTGLPGS